MRNLIETTGLRTALLRASITAATSIVALCSTSSTSAAGTPRPTPTMPRELQWTWAGDVASCEAELTNGMVIRAREVSFYDGPERLLSVHGPVSWQSPKGRARTYIVKFVTNTSPGIGIDADRKKSYSMRYTIVGNQLFVSEATTPRTQQFSVKNMSVKCPRKSYN